MLKPNFEKADGLGISLKSPENFGKFTDREVPVFATLVKSLSQAAASKFSLYPWITKLVSK